MRSTYQKILHFALGLGILITFALPAAALAYTGPLDSACQGNATATVCQDNQKSQSLTDNSIYGPNGIITKAARLLSFIIGVTAVVMIMIAGLKFMTSQGDANQIASARNTALYAVIGLIVAALAQGIILFVLDKVT